MVTRNWLSNIISSETLCDAFNDDHEWSSLYCHSFSNGSWVYIFRQIWISNKEKNIWGKINSSMIGH